MPPAAVPPSTARTPSGGASDKKTEKTLTRRLDEEDIRPYVITSELGKGSFATVYKGYNEVHIVSLLLMQDIENDKVSRVSSCRIRRSKSLSRLSVGVGSLRSCWITCRVRLISSSRSRTVTSPNLWTLLCALPDSLRRRCLLIILTHSVPRRIYILLWNIAQVVT